MDIILGFSYNLKGLKLGIKTPKLLLLGLIRFFAVLFITIITVSIIIVYHQNILGLIWERPESLWILWLWHFISWIIALVLIAVSTVVSYLLTQILFSVFVMDAMSRKTELIITGKIEQANDMPLFRQFFFLIKQELPRAILPVIITLIIIIAGWLTPLGPVLTIISSCLAVIFLAWDNTDLTPARQMIPFKTRFGFLTGNILFHLGFGLWFLIPVLNILFLSFAPVGATLYYLDKKQID
jgi:CysZ protein